MAAKTWFVYDALAPRDRMWEHCMTITQWLLHSGGREHWDAERVDYEEKCAWCAYLAYASVGYEATLEHEDMLRGFVVYDAFADDRFFIFREHNNGSTFFVSEYRLGLSDDIADVREVIMPAVPEPWAADGCLNL